MPTIEQTEVQRGLEVIYKSQPRRPYWYRQIIEVNQSTFPDGKQILQIIRLDKKGRKRIRNIQQELLQSARYYNNPSA